MADAFQMLERRYIAVCAERDAYHRERDTAAELAGKWRAELESTLLKLDRCEELLATAYQLAGLVGAPVRFLDAYALHDGTDADSLLPVGLDELEEFKALQFRLDSAENAMREVVSHLQNSQRGSTHWAGCPDVHPVCKAIAMLVDALPLPRAGETEHPEMWCGDCGRRE